MNIPNKQLVKFLMNQVLHKEKVTSQNLLAIKLKEKMTGQAYAISGKRARQIAIEIPEIKVMIHTKKGGMPRRCPSCNSKLKKVFTKNLKGKKLLFSVSCTKCSYKASQGKWVPCRYVFYV